MLITRTEQIRFRSETISVLAHASKNLYNAANYLIRNRFFENTKIYKEKGVSSNHLWYKELYPLIKDTEEYKALPAQSAQQILRVLDKNWKSYFVLYKKFIKELKVNPTKYPIKTKTLPDGTTKVKQNIMGFPLRESEPSIPKYKNKDGVNILIFTNQQCEIKDGVIKFPKIVNLELKTRLRDIDLREVRIIPTAFNYVCEIVYNKQITDIEIDSSRVLGIDLGVRNIVTIANNFGEKPIVVKGNTANAINQFYNKEKAKIQSVYDKAGIKYGNKLAKLDHVRNNKIKDYFHKLSRHIIDYAMTHNIKTIIIGKNDNWKQRINIGKINNQKFVMLPLAKLIEMIQYKAREKNIEVVLQEESYTSKCSFLDSEPIEHRDKYIGKRIKRGLFRSGKGIIINADVNGALNIIRKATPKAFVDGVEGVGLHPKRCLITSFEYI